MILNCAIVDDEPLALELLRSYVEKTSFLRLVGRYSSAVQAMTEIPLHEEVHVLFLDIQMPELNGLEFSRMVSPETRIIFTTAFDRCLWIVRFELVHVKPSSESRIYD